MQLERIWLTGEIVVLPSGQQDNFDVFFNFDLATHTASDFRVNSFYCIGQPQTVSANFIDSPITPGDKWITAGGTCGTTVNFGGYVGQPPQFEALLVGSVGAFFNPPASVPEPETLGLLALGLVGVALRGRKRFRGAQHFSPTTP